MQVRASRRRLAVAGAVVTVLGISTTVAYATGLVAGGDNTIYGCIKKDGVLRVVSGPNMCKSDETPIQWNQEGPPGPAPRAPQGR